MEWISINDSPINPDWYATAREGEKESIPRYYDDTDDSWWIYSNHHDNNTLVPNNSFTHWMPLPEPPKSKDKGE